MSASLIASFAASALGAAAPIALAALGGLYTAAAGSLSVAIEGSILVGAFAAASIGSASGSLELGLLGGALGGALLAATVAGAANKLRADVFVAGLAANMLAGGAVSALSQSFFGTKGVLPSDALGRGAAHSGSGGFSFLGQGSAFLVLAAAAAILAIMYATSVFGLRLKASGQGSEAARAAGIEPDRYRFVAHLVAGAAAGLAGAYMACTVAAFVPGMSAGRGWIALAAIYLGGRKPAGITLSCLLFGSLFALSNLLQGLRGQVAENAELLQAMPYLASALAFILWKRRGRKAARRKGAMGESS